MLSRRSTSRRPSARSPPTWTQSTSRSPPNSIACSIRAAPGLHVSVLCCAVLGALPRDLRVGRVEALRRRRHARPAHRHRPELHALLVRSSAGDARAHACTVTVRALGVVHPSAGFVSSCMAVGDIGHRRISISCDRAPAPPVGWVIKRNMAEIRQQQHMNSLQTARSAEATRRPR